jgi:hypothetical protein
MISQRKSKAMTKSLQDPDHGSTNQCSSLFPARDACVSTPYLPDVVDVSLIGGSLFESVAGSSVVHKILKHEWSYIALQIHDGRNGRCHEESLCGSFRL